MTTYRAGIIGLTGIASAPAASEPAVLGGEHPHSHAASYANVPQTQVVAVCELASALLNQFDQRWGSIWPGVTHYTDYREMLERERLDLLSVATPDHLHVEMVVDAANAGVKGIYCEKPIATTLVDADRMIAATEELGVAMVVNHTRRWYATYQRARELVRSGRLGKVTHLHAVCGGPRAMLFRNGTHLIDAMNMFAESEPVWVVAHLDPGHEGYGPRYAGAGGRDPALDPGGRALIRYESGVIASVFCSKLINVETTQWEVEVICEHGSVKITEPGGVEVTTIATDPIGGRLVRQLDVPQYRLTDGSAAIAELIGLVERHRSGDRAVEGQSSPREARKTLAILLAILQSQHQGNVPIVAPFVDARR